MEINNGNRKEERDCSDYTPMTRRGIYGQLEYANGRTKMVVPMHGSRDFLREHPEEILAGIPVFIPSLNVCLQMGVDDVEIIDLESCTRFRTSVKKLRSRGTRYNLDGSPFMVLPMKDWDHED